MSSAPVAQYNATANCGGCVGREQCLWPDVAGCQLAGTASRGGTGHRGGGVPCHGHASLRRAEERAMSSGGGCRARCLYFSMSVSRVPAGGRLVWCGVVAAAAMLRAAGRAAAGQRAGSGRAAGQRAAGQRMGQRAASGRAGADYIPAFAVARGAVGIAASEITRYGPMQNRPCE